MRFQSLGRLQYDPIYPEAAVQALESGLGIRAVLWVDQSLSDYYRSLVPKYEYVQPQMHKAHITVVRTHKEVPPNMSFWGKYQNEIIPFEYEDGVKKDHIYYWLSAFSERIAEIRLELGLPIQRDLFKGYHITIGNLKSEPNR